METTAGSTLASTSWMSCGLANTLVLGKYFWTTVCWLLAPDDGSDQSPDQRGHHRGDDHHPHPGPPVQGMADHPGAGRPGRVRVSVADPG